MLERRNKRVTLMFAAPALTFMAFIFLWPIFSVVIQSVITPEWLPNSAVFRVLRATITFEWGDIVESNIFTLAGYIKLISSSLFRKVLWNTFEISLMATVLTLLFAYPIAYYLAKQEPRTRAFLMVLVLLPFWTSILVKSFAFTVVLGTNGMVNSVITLLPWIEQGPKMLFNRSGVMIGLTHFFIPFMVFPIMTSLLAQNPDLAKAAQLMGSGPLRIFFRITFPLSMPGVMAGSLLVFIISLGFFITPALLGGRKDLMMANLVDFYTSETLNWTVAAAISVVLLIVSLLLIFLLSRIPGGKSILGEAD